MRGLWTEPVSFLFFFSCHGTKAVIARDHSVRFYRQPCGQIICKDGLRWEIRIPRLIFFNVFIFNWRIINLQYCVDFAIHQHEPFLFLNTDRQLGYVSCTGHWLENSLTPPRTFVILGILLNFSELQVLIYKMEIKKNSICWI